MTTSSPAATGLRLSEVRPYREPLSWEEVFGILEADAGTAICGPSVEALCTFLATAGPDPLQRDFVP